ncbi:hypothetical protein K438DRAFT_1760392 [Mycena galopus ATCC 62051]|nr:hypothetical protein K438DRAFT_1760392 [Mycena galopus ATCC 62051]
MLPEAEARNSLDGPYSYIPEMTSGMLRKYGIADSAGLLALPPKKLNNKFNCLTKLLEPYVVHREEMKCQEDVRHGLNTQHCQMVLRIEGNRTVKLNRAGSDMERYISEALKLNVGPVLQFSCEINKQSLNDFCTVATVDSRCKALSRTYPDLDNPANAVDDESVVNDGEIAEAASVALAAASQLIAQLQLPAQKILETSLAFLCSAALGVVSASATAEIIREAGPQVSLYAELKDDVKEMQGCHIKEIAKKNGMDHMKIGNQFCTAGIMSGSFIPPGRVLRPLATQHIFREVSPDVFAHNRVSVALDTGKSSKEVLAAPEDKHHGSKGYAAVVELVTDETLKAGAYIQDVVLTAHENDADELDTPLNRAFNTHVDLFSWLELPENRVRFRRFGMAMEASRRIFPPTSGLAVKRFNWSSLPENTLIVDVGAGIGSISFGIAKANPQLRFVIQDKASVIQEGKELKRPQFWDKELPCASASGRVSFQEHNFFSPQPAKNADFFLLSRICHDWSDAYTLRILKHLRDAAQPTTKLIIQERIILFVCGENEAYGHIPGAMPNTTPPKPLLANMGRIVPYLIDMQMMAVLSGCERTLPHYCQLATEAGWEIEAVYRDDGLEANLTCNWVTFESASFAGIVHICAYFSSHIFFVPSRDREARGLDRDILVSTSNRNCDRGSDLDQER